MADRSSGSDERSARVGRGRSRPSLARALPDEVIEIVAVQLQVLAEPTRIRLLALLNEEPATVQQLTDRLPTTHQNVSRHLGLLHQAGMVRREKDGTSVRYSLVDWTGWWVIEQIASSVAAQADELHELLTDAPADRSR